MPAGSIIIDLLMRTGSFETDTKRAEKRLKEMQRSAEQVGAAIGVAIVGGATAAVVAFDQLNKGAANFQDIAETVGDSAENVASLAVATATAGVDMQSLAAASIKLSKGLVGVDDESKAAGAALKFLNLNIEQFRQLSPVQQYEAVGVAIGKIANEQDKVAIATTLFGKAGAEQLKVFKALEESGGRQVILTQAQIERADAYADAQARNGALIKLYAQAVATELLPAYNDLTEAGLEFVKALVGIEKAGDKIARDNAVRQFADDALSAIAATTDFFGGLTDVVVTAARATGGYWAAITAAMTGDFAAAKNIAFETLRDIEAAFNKSGDTFGDKLRKRMRARQVADANPASYSNEGRAPTPVPGARFQGAQPRDKAPKQSDADKYIDSLRHQLQTTQELTALEKLWDDIGRGRLGHLTTEQMVVLDGLAAQIDAMRELKDMRKADNEALTEANKRVQENYERAQQMAQSVETPMERLQRVLANINQEAQNNPFLTDETRIRMSQQAWADYADSVDAAAKKNNEFAEMSKRTFEDAFGDTITAAFEGKLGDVEDLWKNALKRMAIEATRAALMKAAFGDSNAPRNQQGQTDTGWIGAIGTIISNWGGSYAEGGRPPMGRTSLVGEHGPELFVPNTAGRIIPNELLGQSGSGDVEIINPPGMPLRGQVQEQRANDGRMMKRVILQTLIDDVNAGGSAVTALTSRTGTKRQLPRRGR
jgi:hypothetical protein